MKVVAICTSLVWWIVGCHRRILSYNHYHKAYCERSGLVHALTRKDEGVLDSIALDEVALYAVHTLNDVFVKSLHIVYSTNCHSVLCITLDWVQYTREGSVYELSSLRCSIVYPVWVVENITVSTDEGELVWTVAPLELQGNIEGSCEVTATRYIWEWSTRQCSHTLYFIIVYLCT